MDKKVLFALGFVLGILVVASATNIIFGQTTENSTILAAITGLSRQLSSMETNIMDHIQDHADGTLQVVKAMDARLAAMETKIDGMSAAVGGPSPLGPVLQYVLILVVITLILCIVNLVLLLRKPKAIVTKESKTETKESK